MCFMVCVLYDIQNMTKILRQIMNQYLCYYFYLSMNTCVEIDISARIKFIVRNWIEQKFGVYRSIDMGLLSNILRGVNVFKNFILALWRIKFKVEVVYDINQLSQLSIVCQNNASKHLKLDLSMYKVCLSSSPVAA